MPLIKSWFSKFVQSLVISHSFHSFFFFFFFFFFLFLLFLPAQGTEHSS